MFTKPAGDVTVPLTVVSAICKCPVPPPPPNLCETSASEVCSKSRTASNSARRLLPADVVDAPSVHADSLIIDQSLRLYCSPYRPSERVQRKVDEQLSFLPPEKARCLASDQKTEAAAFLANLRQHCLESPSQRQEGRPAQVKVDKDRSGRIFTVGMNDCDKQYQFRFDASGNLTSLEIRRENITELTNFGTSGKAISQSFYSLGFAQVTTFNEYGVKRTQQTTTPEFQENLLFSSTGEITSKVRQTKNGYEIYTLRPDGGSLRKRDDQKVYVKVETRPDGSCATMVVDKERRLTTRSVYNPKVGSREVCESDTQIVESVRDLFGELISQNLIVKDSAVQDPPELLA